LNVSFLKKEKFNRYNGGYGREIKDMAFSETKNK